MATSPLDAFSPATREWFRAALGTPTPAQAEAWAAIGSGNNALVIAPTGSGKTLAAFLWSLDRLLARPVLAEPGVPRCRVLYISPLKALAADIERNLRAPLSGIRQVARTRGEEPPDVLVHLRSGDTPPEERRRFARLGADILITTPESLFLLLTSQAREALAAIDTVIVDEIHSLAATKRGAHLAVSLERLDALLPRPAQRIGLSATVRPPEAVAEFLAGGRAVTIVAPPAVKQWRLSVEVPVPDLGDLANAPAAGAAGAGGPGAGTGAAGASASGVRSADGGTGVKDADSVKADGKPSIPRVSVWPHVTERLVDLVAAHRSTIVFVNSRQVAERLATRINDVWETRARAGDPDYTDPELRRMTPPAGFIGSASVAAGSPAVAMAHHGSMSHERRREIEEALKAGALRAVVATSSLELGIDMGAVDLVIQVEAPMSVASGLQRIGRAGHQVGAVSEGHFFPKYLGDLVAMTVVVERMRAGLLEETRIERNPLDVLAQQAVAMAAMDAWTVDGLLELFRRSAPFRDLSRRALDGVLDMLSGRYPSEEFAELRPRVDWDKAAGRITGRRGAQRLAVTSGGTIPDRGLYGVFLDSGEGAGRRVGELDEEMVFESRVGDTITLGSSSWLITAITPDQVRVAPAPGAPGRLPFWKGDGLGRSAELGGAIGAFTRELAGLPEAAARGRLAQLGLDDWAQDNLIGYLADQQAATGVIPDDRTVVVESFRDELGDWRVVVLSPWGYRVHLPWSLLLAAEFARAYGVDIQAMPTDDGIVFRLPDTAEGWDADAPPAWAQTGLAAHLVTDPDAVEDQVRAELAHSAHFTARFREAAARSLLLPRRQPGRRQPLWQLRNRAAQLLQVASRYPQFPVMLEAARETLHDDFDLPALTALMAGLASRSIRLVEVTTPRASPFARTVLFNYVGLFMYDYDTPLAELRAAALTVDTTLLSDLLGGSGGLDPADLLDPEVVALAEAELQCLTDSRLARDAEDLHDLVRRLGPIAAAALGERTRAEVRDLVPAWLAGLLAAGQIEPWDPVGSSRQAGPGEAVPPEPSPALGPAGPSEAAAPPDSSPALGPTGPREVRWVAEGEAGLSLGSLAARFARSHGPFTLAECAAWLEVAPAEASHVLDWLAADGRLIAGNLKPGAGGEQAYCDPQVLARLRRRSLAKLRAEVEPVPGRVYARFLLDWQGVGDPAQRGLDGLRRAVDQLAGVAVPASMLETFVLPARVADYHPTMLDELIALGEVQWAGRGELSGGDGWLTLLTPDLADVFAPSVEPELGDLDRAVLEALRRRGAFRAAEVAAAIAAGTKDVLESLWRLAWAGLVSTDTLAPLRERLGQVRPTIVRRPAPARARTGRPRLAVSLVASPRLTANDIGGRWFATIAPAPGEREDARRAVARAEVLLDRYGVVTRGAVRAEDTPGGFAGVYRVLALAEDQGKVRRGYFVDRLGGSQFAPAGAVDRLRACDTPLADPSGPANPAGPAGPPGGDPQAAKRPRPAAGPAAVLAAADPANAYGAVLPWPAHDGTHQPARKAGALVALLDGEPVLFVERGGHSVLTWTDDPAALRAAAAGLAASVHDGKVDSLTVATIDGRPALTRDPSPLAAALQGAGFVLGPQGWRLRR